ncbi:O-methyltransferase [Trichoderma cornu-damae]|uniref:O-methyltransferase n=1 Tax=Trichoderma cornu-damae TaxID=654480 RepID=A0A9P8QWG5_9HYPO|nr:O-methyltransferase [Trichoderma cornu-damae]
MGISSAKPTAESSVDRLTTLSRNIEEKTRVLTDALRTKGLEAPSYRADGLSDIPLTEVDREAIKARQEIVELAKELHDLVLGPRESLKNMAWGAICELKVAEAVPLTGSISYRDLAAEAKFGQIDQV